jgi:hypothetical protein
MEHKRELILIFNRKERNLKMNAKRVVSALIIAIFITPNLYAGPCINCVATAFKKDTTNQETKNQWNNKHIIESANDDYIEGIIPLDDNAYDDETIAVADNETNPLYEDSNIILTYDDSSQIEEITKTLYACEDIINNIVACDEEEQGECECV